MNNELDYVAYKGNIYQIEFYFDAKGKSQPIDYKLEKFTGADAKKFEHLLILLGDVGQIRNKEKFRNEGGKYMPLNHSHIAFCAFSLKEIKSLLPMPL